MRPQFIGTGQPQILVRGAHFSPVTFTPGSTHTARIGLVNPTAWVWAYKGEVYLDSKIARSGIVEFTIEAGAQRPIDFPIVMPQVARTYQAFLDVLVGEQLILHYAFVESVDIMAVPIVTLEEAITGVPIPPPTAVLGVAGIYTANITVISQMPYREVNRVMVQVINISNLARHVYVWFTYNAIVEKRTLLDLPAYTGWAYATVDIPIQFRSVLIEVSGPGTPASQQRIALP